MTLSRSKQAALGRLIDLLPLPQGSDGQRVLRNTFHRSAPVYGPFWDHVLHGSPLFDVYTNVAFQFFSSRNHLTKENARVTVPDHWTAHGAYALWFERELQKLQKQTPAICSRRLDRALFMWGQYHCQPIGEQRYRPNRREAEWIDNVLQPFFRCGYEAAGLPKIVISDAIPPAIERGARSGESADHGDRDDSNWDIDELLGRYQPNDEKIVIYRKGIWRCANRLAPPASQSFAERLFCVVLLHEIGHWITHVLPNPLVDRWPTEHFKTSDMSVLESWAQLIVHHALPTTCEERSVFNALVQRQSAPYRLFLEKNMHKSDWTALIESLVRLRALTRAADMGEWLDICSSDPRLSPDAFSDFL
ncbi:MAG: hypothetical protein EOP84_04005 [Verrucomicrobiaceae bacterium]|nr:MAG: hypothetical protein EOP84_04005 [Verrucomicrobiaceae bacterium]